MGREVVAADDARSVHRASQGADAVEVAHDAFGRFAGEQVPIDRHFVGAKDAWMHPLNRRRGVQVGQRHADRVIERQVQVWVADAPVLDKGDVAAGTGSGDTDGRRLQVASKCHG